MEEPTSEPQKPTKQQRNRKANKILVPIVLILLFIVIISATSHGSGVPSKKASYKATVDVANASVINPATLGVAYHVTNTGNAPGSPTCTIQVGDVNSTYEGSDGMTLDTIQPGQTVTGADNLTITKQGAQYVTQGTMSCQ